MAIDYSKAYKNATKLDKKNTEILKKGGIKSSKAGFTVSGNKNNKITPKPKTAVSAPTIMSTKNSNIPMVSLPKVSKTNEEEKRQGIIGRLLGNMFDSKENYVQKAKKGNIGGAALNFVGTGLTGAQSIALNGLNAIDSAATGKGLPEFHYQMSGDDYQKEIAKRRGEKTLNEKARDISPLLGGAVSLGYEILTDPLELTPFGYANDIKTAKGTNQATAAYMDNLQKGKISREAAVKPERMATEKIPTVGADGKIRYQSIQVAAKVEPPRILNNNNSKIVTDPLVPTAYKSGSGIARFSAQDITNLSSNKGIANKSEGDFKQFIQYAKSSDKSKRFYFGKVGKELSDDIKNSTHINVEDYNIAIRNDEIKHIFKNHGNATEEAQRGQVGITEEILEKLPQVFNKPDRITVSPNKDYAGRVAIELEKRINGYAIVTTGVSDGKSALFIDTMRVVNKKKPLHTFDVLKTPNPTPITSMKPASSSSIVQQPIKDVNEFKDSKISTVKNFEEGQWVRANDRGNYGKIIGKTGEGRYDVEFTSPDKYSKTVNFKDSEISNAFDVELSDDIIEEAKRRMELPEEESALGADMQRQGKKEDYYSRPLQKDQEYKLNSKAMRYQIRQENNFLNEVAKSMGISKYADRRELKGTISEITEALKYGDISEAQKNALFEKMYNQGIVTMDEFYKEYKPIKDYLRSTMIKVTDREKLNIADFTQFRKYNFGTLKLSDKEGMQIDTVYEGLREAYPGMFKEVNTTEEMLEELSSVSKSIKKTEENLDYYYGFEADEFKNFAYEEFDKAFSKLNEEAQVIKRYAADAKEKDAFSEVSLEEIKEIYKNLMPAQRKAEKIINATLLTKKDNVQVDRLLKGEITLNELPKGTNAQDIKKVYEAKKIVADLTKPIEGYNKKYKSSLRERADELLTNSDKWKDKKIGYAYQREMEERNFVDVAGKVEGERLIEEYITPVHKNEALSNKFKNSYRERVKSLELQNKKSYDASSLYGTIDSAKKNKVSERALAQMYGEGIFRISRERKEGQVNW